MASASLDYWTPEVPKTIFTLSIEVTLNSHHWRFADHHCWKSASLTKTWTLHYDFSRSLDPLTVSTSLSLSVLQLIIFKVPIFAIMCSLTGFLWWVFLLFNCLCEILSPIWGRLLGSWYRHVCNFDLEDHEFAVIATFCSTNQSICWWIIAWKSMLLLMLLIIFVPF